MTSFRSELESWHPFEGKPPSAGAWAIHEHRERHPEVDAFLAALIRDEDSDWRMERYGRRYEQWWHAKEIEAEIEAEKLAARRVAALRKAEREQDREFFLTTANIERAHREAADLEEEKEARQKGRPLSCAFASPDCFPGSGFLIRGTWVCFNHIADAYAYHVAYDLVRE